MHVKLSLGEGVMQTEERMSVHAQVEAMLLLRGTLNVACLEAVYEDKHCVYIVMELCRGGDIFKAMKTNPSNEIMV